MTDYAKYASTYTDAAKSSDGAGDKFVRLADDGDFFDFVPVGNPCDPFPRPSKFDTNGPALYGAINVYSVEEKRMKIYEAKVRVFGSVMRQLAKSGANQVYRVVRSGAKGDKKTSYACIPIRPATAEELAAAVSATAYKLGADAQTAGGNDIPF